MQTTIDNFWQVAYISNCLVNDIARWSNWFKTSPSQGGVTGSSPVRVISSSHDSLKALIYQRFEAFIFAKNQ